MISYCWLILQSAFSFVFITSNQFSFISGKVYSLGRKEYGRLGLGENLEEKAEPTLIPGLADKHCVRIDCGTATSFATTDNGKVALTHNVLNCFEGHKMNLHFLWSTLKWHSWLQSYLMEADEKKWPDWILASFDISFERPTRPFSTNTLLCYKDVLTWKNCQDLMHTRFFCLFFK